MDCFPFHALSPLLPLSPLEQRQRMQCFMKYTHLSKICTLRIPLGDEIYHFFISALHQGLACEKYALCILCQCNINAHCAVLSVICLYLYFKMFLLKFSMFENV